MTRSASAPGKIVLSGEYAVLDGAPAICMAVNRRARARVCRAEGNTGLVAAPGFTGISGEYRVRGGRIEWLRGADAFDLVDAVLQTLGVAEPLDMTLDSGAFLDTASAAKLGLGSSAALCTALCAAMRGDTAVSDCAARAHSRFQQGRGSGADVACSVHGGLIEYRMDGAQVTAPGWPEALSFRVVWTGTAAPTTAKLRRLQTADRHASRTALAEQSRYVAEAWGNGDAEALLAAYSRYVEVLRQFSNDHDLGVFDGGHDELSRAAEAVGVIYKPCGAGGGDVGIALSADSGRLEDFARPYASRVLNCGLDLRGAAMERSLSGDS